MASYHSEWAQTSIRAPLIDPSSAVRCLTDSQSFTMVSHIGGEGWLVWSHGASTAVRLDFMSFHTHSLLVSIDSLLIYSLILSSNEFQEVSPVLRCGSLHLVLSVTDEGSMIIVGVFTKLITGDPFPLLLGVLAGVMFVDS